MTRTAFAYILAPGKDRLEWRTAASNSGMVPPPYQRVSHVRCLGARVMSQSIRGFSSSGS